MIEYKTPRKKIIYSITQSLSNDISKSFNLVTAEETSGLILILVTRWGIEDMLWDRYKYIKNHGIQIT